MNRITKKMLDAKVETINHLMGESTAAYTRNAAGSLKANVGTFVLEAYAPGDRYGTRYNLSRMVNDGGATTTIIPTVLGAQNFYDALYAFIRGLELASEMKNGGKVAA